MAPRRSRRRGRDNVIGIDGKQLIFHEVCLFNTDIQPTSIIRLSRRTDNAFLGSHCLPPSRQVSSQISRALYIPRPHHYVHPRTILASWLDPLDELLRFESIWWAESLSESRQWLLFTRIKVMINVDLILGLGKKKRIQGEDRQSPRAWNA